MQRGCNITIAKCYLHFKHNVYEYIPSLHAFSIVFCSSNIVGIPKNTASLNEAYGAHNLSHQTSHDRNTVGEPTDKKSSSGYFDSHTPIPGLLQ